MDIAKRVRPNQTYTRRTTGHEWDAATMPECVEHLLLTRAVDRPRIDSTLLHRIRSTRPTWMLHPQGEYTVYNGYYRNLAIGGVGYTAVEGGS